MSSSMPKYKIVNPSRKHFSEIQDLCRRVYPFSKPWSVAQLESHQAHFPEGQLIAVETKTGKVVGLAFSLIISWDDYSQKDNWTDFTSGGYFHNHNPRKGKTLYGAEVMVDPDCRGQGIGKKLYAGRIEIVKKYKLKRIRAGARLRGYGKYADKMSPEEYTREVIEKRIFDPTLSFQLGAGFEVLDVARNYIYNDPESLGFAAVIEWLNPEAANERDFKKHTATVKGFLADEFFIPHLLPRELKLLVRKVTIMLGQTIREHEGEAFYQKIERYRVKLKKMRKRKNIDQLKALMKRLKSESHDDQLKIAHGFALLMELINVCEAAYRTWRLQQKPMSKSISKKTLLNFVLTSHPTEARAPLVLDLLQETTDLLTWGLQSNFDLDEITLKTKLRSLWKIPISKSKKPQVKDEAEFIFSLVLNQPIFDFILADKPSYDIMLRTWVGGDKDGHPGVTPEIMIECLNISRIKILNDIYEKLEELNDDLVRITKPSRTLESFMTELKNLEKICDKDAQKVTLFQDKFLKFLESQDVFLKDHHCAVLIKRIFLKFPGLVLPIELREDSGEISLALKDKNKPIAKMLQKLKSISQGKPATLYARGLVVSHCESAEDIQNAKKLISDQLGQLSLPVVPLFESRQALESSRKILKYWLQNFNGQQIVKSNWENKFEVMLGYSDSAKEMGVLGSRKLIQKSMFSIQSLLKNYKIRPVFFQGSGGSVARGGGSLKEQITWWPETAVRLPKMTVQGEMIQRLFATEEVLNSQALHMSRESQLRRARKVKINNNKVFDLFAQQVEESYRSFVADYDQLREYLSATPYDYLEVLKLGSRPSKRKKEFSLSSLRAIPWVLCWTQTRILTPTWWGLGSAWNRLNKEQKAELQELFKKDMFFSSFVKTVGFTLEKVEPEIWQMYLNRVLKSQEAEKQAKKFANEYKKSKKFVLEVSGEKSLLWYRPWLEESIRLRGAYIHILNLLQIIAMEKNDEELLRKTLVGIASGMLTTG